MNKIRDERVAAEKAAQAIVGRHCLKLVQFLRMEFGRVATETCDFEELTIMLEDLAQDAATEALRVEGSFRLKESQAALGNTLSTILQHSRSQKQNKQTPNANQD